MRIVKATLSSIGTCIAVLFVLGMMGQTAEAREVLFDGSIPPTDIDDIGFNDPDAGGQRLAEDFQLANASTVNGVTFLGGYYPTSTPGTDAFTLTIFGDDNGLPDPSNILSEIPIDVERTDTGVNALGIRLYSYAASFTGVELAATTPYWIMIVNDTTTDENDDWVWAGSHEGGVYARSFDGGLTWFDTPPGAFSFQVLGEPIQPNPVEVATWGSVKSRYQEE